MFVRAHYAHSLAGCTRPTLQPRQHVGLGLSGGCTHPQALPLTWEGVDVNDSVLPRLVVDDDVDPEE